MTPLYRFAWFLMGATFLLIVAGGLVTSTNSGLSVPDWPLSYGTLFPPMVGGIRFEHTHRMIAGFVGILTVVMTVWILLSRQRRSLRWLAIGGLGLVVLQAILGGLIVLRQLPAPISIAHACLGPTFFALTAVLVTLLSPQKNEQGRMGRLPLAVTAAIFGQMTLGAITRHTGTALGAHIVGAGVVIALVAKLLRTIHLESISCRRAQWLGRFLVLQLLLGILAVLTRNQVWIATAHVAVGALLLAISSSLTVDLFRSSHPTLHGLRVYLELTKPRLTGLAVFTAFLGYLLGCSAPWEWGKFFSTLLGTALVGAGAGVLNQYLERLPDAQMRRTCRRPLPSGRISAESALAFGVTLSVAGLLILSKMAHPLSGGLAAVTLGLYLFAYTPLKRRTSLCTLVGAIPGAIPPLIGWTAARGSLGLQGWLLFAILFLWQLPHFLAIAWLHREDYLKAGFKMLPVLDPEGGMTGRQIALYCMALVPVSLLPAALGMAGWAYFLLALASSLAFLGFGLLAAVARSGRSATRLFLASVAYLPFLLTTLTLDRIL